MLSSDSQSFIRPEEFWQELGLRANQTVVHLGCGPGFYLIPAARIVGPGGRVIGVDVRGDMLSEVESKAEREGVAQIIATYRHNIETEQNNEIPSETSDWTLIANILYQADPDKVIAEAARVTSPSGKIVIVEWNTAATPLGPPPESRISQPDVLSIASRYAFELDNEFEPSSYHYGLLLRRVRDEGSQK